jgi:hypothetical protein
MLYFFQGSVDEFYAAVSFIVEPVEDIAVEDEYGYYG